MSLLTLGGCRSASHRVAIADDFPLISRSELIWDASRTTALHGAGPHLSSKAAVSYCYSILASGIFGRILCRSCLKCSPHSQAVSTVETVFASVYNPNNSSWHRTRISAASWLATRRRSSAWSLLWGRIRDLGWPFAIQRSRHLGQRYVQYHVHRPF